MPITKEELKQYSVYLGTNPMPEDFDVFWDARVEEARQIPLKYHLSASEIPDFDTCRFSSTQNICSRPATNLCRWSCSFMAIPVQAGVGWNRHPLPVWVVRCWRWTTLVRAVGDRMLAVTRVLR